MWTSSETEPFRRPGIKDVQANYWMKGSFQRSTDYLGASTVSRYYSGGPIKDLRPGHRAVEIVSPAFNGKKITLIHVNTIEDTTISELPLAAITALSPALELNTSVDQFNWRTDYLSINIENKEPIEAIFFNEYCVSNLGSVSFLGDCTDSGLVIDIITGLKSSTGIKCLVLDLVRETNEIRNCQWNDFNDLTKKIFFLVKANLQTATIVNGQWIPVREPFVFLATLSKFDEFRSNLNYTSKLFKSLENNPMQFFPDANYKRQLVERASKLCTYWGGLAEVLDFTQIQSDDIPDINFISLAKASATKLTNAQLAALSADNEAYNTREGSVYIRLTEALSNVEQEISALEISAAPKQKLIDRNSKTLETLIVQYNAIQQKLTEYQDKVQTLLKAFEEENTDLVSKKRIKESLAPKAVSAESAFKQKLLEIRTQLKNSPTDFETKLDKLGIIITDAVLRQKTTGTEVPLVDNEHLLDNETWYLGKLSFITTRPHLIYVDRLKHGASAPTIAGGPYEINLSCFYNDQEKKFYKPQMFLRLASVDAVFGKIKDGLQWKAKIHPHTQPSVLLPTIDSLKRFVENAHSVCLGEAESVITEGFRTKDIWVAITACLSWITSANTQNLEGEGIDEYGAAWTWFPSASEVSMSGKWSEAFLNSETTEIETVQEPEALIQEQTEEEQRWERIVSILKQNNIPIPTVNSDSTSHNNTGAAATILRKDS